jgi:hypothetical protein
LGDAGFLAFKVLGLHANRRFTMICPACKSENEMPFSALSQSFICQEPECGFEVQMERQDVETLLNPELERTVA